MLDLKIKKELLSQCQNFVNKRLQTIEEIISSNQKALQSETKSSAGDKHETGRAMLQLEMEKASQQLASVQKMKSVLSKINISNSNKIAHLGSIVTTNLGVFYLSISAGKITVNNKIYFAISTMSPIGRLLLGKKENEKFLFQNKEIQVVIIK